MRIAPTALMSIAMSWCLLPRPCSAITIHVPADQPTIQAGIAAASAGDTVSIACGTYFEHDIVLATSGICLRSATGLPGCVTIDAEEQGRVFEISNVDSTTYLVGLTITGGRSSGGGGGVRCASAAPRFISCIIRNNQAVNFSSGGAVSCSAGSSARFVDCVISDNRASGCGGIGASHSSLSFERCEFRGNQGTYAQGAVGAVSAGTYASVVLSDCSFVGNISAANAGALRIGPLCNAILERCTFQGNVAEDDGGAVFVSSSRFAASECVFDSNTAVDAGGAVLMSSLSAPASIKSCTFSHNQAAAGGAIYSRGSLAPVLVEHCTLSENSAPIGGGIRCESPVNLTLSRTVIAFSSSGEAVRCEGPDEVTLECCDLFGNAGGDWTSHIAAQYGEAGNISADPLFCGDSNPLLPYLLDGASPCAVENNPECGQIGAWPVGCGAVQGAEQAEHGTAPRLLLGIAPNPVRSSALITYLTPAGPGGSPPRLTVHDASGRVVRSLGVPLERAARQTITWDGLDEAGARVAAGLYYCRLRWHDRSETLPVVVVQ